MEALAVLIAAVCHALTMLVFYAAIGVFGLTLLIGLLIFAFDVYLGRGK